MPAVRPHSLDFFPPAQRPRTLWGEMGETCSCLTPHTSLAGWPSTHLTCRRNTGQGETGLSRERGSDAAEGIFQNAYLFS